MKIRSAKTKDLKEISSLINNGFNRKQKKFLSTNFFENPNIICLVVFNNYKVIGTASLYLLEKIDCIAGQIEDVVVDEKFRGKGIGSSLVKALIEKAKKANCYKVMLNCKKENKGFYDRLGFVCNEFQMIKRF